MFLFQIINLVFLDEKARILFIFPLSLKNASKFGFFKLHSHILIQIAPAPDLILLLYKTLETLVYFRMPPNILNLHLLFQMFFKYNQL